MKAKILLSIFLILVFSRYLQAQLPQWDLICSGYGNSAEYGFATATDPSGNIITVGTTYSTLITIGNIKLYHDLGNQFYGVRPTMYIAKYNQKGDVLWAAITDNGTVNGVYPTFVTTDFSGNIIVAGWFDSDSMKFGNITLNNKVTFGYAEAFIVEYDPLGNILWVKSSKPHLITGCRANFVTTDLSGNIIVTGSFSGNSLQFDTIKVSVTGNEESASMFIVKFSPSGNPMWVKYSSNDSIETASGSVTSYCEGDYVTSDLNNNIYVTGQFGGPAVYFDNDSLTTIGNNTNIFVAKYAQNGDFIWVKSIKVKSVKDDRTARPYSLTRDNANNLYMLGNFTSDTLLAGNKKVTLGKYDYTDMFITKFDTSFNIEWIKKSNASGGLYSLSMSTTNSGDCYILGQGGSDSILFGNYTLINGNAPFFVKYDSSGNVVWARNDFPVQDYSYMAGSSVMSVVADNFKQVYISVSFVGKKDTLGSYILINKDTSGQTSDTYIARLDDSTMLFTGENYIVEKSVDLSVYPNPCSTCFIAGDMNVNDLTVTDILGRKMPVSFSRQLNSYIIQFLLPASGIYIIRSYQTGAATKFVKE